MYKIRSCDSDEKNRKLQHASIHRIGHNLGYTCSISTHELSTRSGKRKEEDRPEKAWSLSWTEEWRLPERTADTLLSILRIGRDVSCQSGDCSATTGWSYYGWLRGVPWELLTLPWKIFKGNPLWRAGLGRESSILRAGECPVGDYLHQEKKGIFVGGIMSVEDDAWGGFFFFEWGR